jgi:predicted O-linked N-acetylglucosamine transferase (SPINDLY family)
LWAGVPLVALAGDTFASRVSASILTAAGLPELITSSPADYYNLALRLAGDPGALAGLRARVKGLRAGGPLFDTTLFTRDLERALAAAWERHCAGLAPAHIVLD